MLSINKRKEGITRSTSLNCFCSFNNQFICNEHTEVIFTFDDLFFAGYMNVFV